MGVDSPKLRAITWKLALGYLPVDHSHRPAQLAQQRQLYHQWVVELTTDPSALLRSSSPSLCGEREGVGGAWASILRRVKVRAEVRADGQVRLVVNVEADEGEDVEVHQETEGVGAMDAEALGISDHPLSTEDGSVWREWHLDEELRQEIRKDVDRTLPDYSFFNREQVGSHESPSSPSPTCSGSLPCRLPNPTTHHATSCPPSFFTPQSLTSSQFPSAPLLPSLAPSHFARSLALSLISLPHLLPPFLSSHPPLRSRSAGFTTPPSRGYFLSTRSSTQGFVTSKG